MIVGGGKVTYYVAKKLIENGISVKIIERDRTKCDELSDLLPRAEIIHGDGIDEDLLLEEGIEVVDGFTALTGLDEQNIMIGLFAKSVSKSNVKLVTKITKISFDDVIAGLNLGSIVNPKEITADYILQFVRSMQASVGSEMENLYKLPDSNAEAMEFHIGEQCKACDIPLQKLRLKKNILIAKIYRGDHLFTPTGSDYMQVGDTVVLVALREHKITNLDDILES